jgi:hypothetical protein
MLIIEREVKIQAHNMPFWRGEQFKTCYNESLELGFITNSMEQSPS